MKYSIWIMIVAFVLLSGCTMVEIPEKTEATKTPFQTSRHIITETAAQTISPTTLQADDVVSTPILDVSEDEPVEYNFVEYYIEDAESCRTVVDGVEYYLDTNYYIFQDYFPEFPLFKIDEYGLPEYMGTTGFWFQANGNYIYIKTDVLQEDWPDGTLTRVVNLIDGSIKPIERNINIFIPSEGDCVYYTWWTNQIFVADQSLEVDRIIDVKIPDIRKIEEKSGENLDGYEQVVNITDVKDGWIYFRYFIFMYEGFMYEGCGLYEYEGNYRIKTDGKSIEKTDEGQMLEY